ncbi:MAG: hypothetical protein JSS02_13025 [Planctomycetes bacterium]|nr:hypothetical protein [Planctomycetota bacterium]
MQYNFPPDLAQLVKDQMVAGEYPSEDDLLRDALRTLDEKRHTALDEDSLVIEGIRRGLSDMKTGHSLSLDEFDRQFRADHGLECDV